MLEKLLTSRTRVKLLTLFLLNPERGFYVRQLCRLTGQNVNAVRRELSNLESIGIVSSKPTGNTKTYIVNRGMPIYKELVSLVLKTEGIADVLKARMSKIGRVESAYIYGSFASGKARVDSDIDLFVVGDVDEDELENAVEEVEDRVSRHVNYVVFSSQELEERKRNGDPFISNVLGGPKIALIGED